MRADVEEEYLALGDLDGEDDAILIGQADGMEARQFTSQGVNAQVWREWVRPQIVDERCETRAKIWVLAEEAAGTTQEPIRCGDLIRSHLRVRRCEC